jgi:hypothetical protein
MHDEDEVDEEQIAEDGTPIDTDTATDESNE